MYSGVRKHGSFEDYMLHFAREGRQLGWKVGFVFPAVGASEIVEQLQREGAETFIVAEPWNSKQGCAGLIERIRSFRPSLVNFHFCDPIAQLRVFLHCRLRSIPIVYHYHGEIRPLPTLRWRNKHLSALRLVAPLWKRIITVSRANERFLRALRVGGAIDVVYNGIDVPRFLRESEAAAANLPAREENQHVLCLYIGSLIRRKRVDVLIRAFSLAVKRCPNARLTVVGEGELEGSMKALSSELQLDEKVHFAGLLMDYPFALLKTSDIFVSASESESFGLVFAEAMVCELPVVACDVGGIPEVVADGSTGLLVKPADPQALATALVTLIEDRTMRQRMGAAGLDRVTRQFQLRDTVDATLRIFADLV
jgi:glycosyltransferase involved in cell wall biosynthesis